MRLLQIPQHPQTEPRVLDRHVTRNHLILGVVDVVLVQLAAALVLPASPLQVDPPVRHLEHVRHRLLQVDEDVGGATRVPDALLEHGPLEVEGGLLQVVDGAGALVHVADLRLELGVLEGLQVVDELGRDVSLMGLFGNVVSV